MIPFGRRRGDLKATYRRPTFGQHRQGINTLGFIAAQAAYDHAEDWQHQVVDYLDGTRVVASLATGMAQRPLWLCTSQAAVPS